MSLSEALQAWSGVGSAILAGIALWISLKRQDKTDLDDALRQKISEVVGGLLAIERERTDREVNAIKDWAQAFEIEIAKYYPRREEIKGDLKEVEEQIRSIDQKLDELWRWLRREEK